MRAIRRTTATALLAGIATVLVACTGTAVPTDSPSTPPASVSPPSPSASPEPDPELVPTGTAHDNLPYFDFVNSSFLADGNPGGRAIIDNLVAAGFARDAMQVTADRTPLGNDADSVQFSVRIADECLIGQVDDDGYTSTVADALQSGSCLVGKTRAIDW